MGDGSWSTQGTGNGADDGQRSDLKGPSFFLLKVMGERGVTLTVRKPGRACPQTEAQHLKYQLYCTLQHMINVPFVISLHSSQVGGFLLKWTVSLQRQEPGVLQRPPRSCLIASLPWHGVLLTPCIHGLGSPSSLAEASEWFVPFFGFTSKLELSQGTNAIVVIRKRHPSRAHFLDASENGLELEQ